MDTNRALAELSSFSSVVTMRERSAWRPLSHLDFGADDDSSSGTDWLTAITGGAAALATGAANVYTAVAGTNRPATPVVTPPPVTTSLAQNKTLLIGLGAAALILVGGLVLMNRR